MSFSAVVTPVIPTLAVVIAAVLFTAALLMFGERLQSREVTFRIGSISGLVEMKVMWLGVGTALITAVLVGVGLTVGDYPVPASRALATALWDRNGEYDFVINHLRFPRIVVAVLAGMCLAASGFIFQSLINNPLVSPDIIGINAGAAVCAIAILAIGGNVSYVPWAAFVGALLTAGLVYVLSWKRGVEATRIVLVGIGINALLGSVITFIIVRYPIEQVVAAARWQAGTLFDVSGDDARTLAIGLLVLLPLAFVFTVRLRVLQLGDEVATAVGSSIEPDRLALLAVGSLLAALATSVIGPLGFVALIVPQAARMLVGTISGGALLLTSLFGGFFLLGADLVALRLFAPVMLPAGIVTAALGGPYFLFLLARYNRAT